MCRRTICANASGEPVPRYSAISSLSVISSSAGIMPPADAGSDNEIHQTNDYTGFVAEIVLTTLNARYAHASFGLRYLMANLGEELRGRAALVEFDIAARSVDAVE